MVCYKDRLYLCFNFSNIIATSTQIVLVQYQQLYESVVLIMRNYKKRSNGFSTKSIHVPYEHNKSRTAVVPPIFTSAIYRQDEPETIVVRMSEI